MPTALLTAKTARAAAIEIDAFRSLAFGDFARLTYLDDSDDVVVVWTSIVRDVNSGARGMFSADERNGDLVAAAVDWSRA